MHYGAAESASLLPLVEKVRESWTGKIQFSEQRDNMGSDVKQHLLYVEARNRNEDA